VRTATKALAGPDRELKFGDLEAAVLSRTNGRRCFSRLGDDEVSALLSE
jgi:proteasome alpha subunit